MTWVIKTMVEYPSDGRLAVENVKKDYLVYDNCLQIFKNHWRESSFI